MIKKIVARLFVIASLCFLLIKQFLFPIFITRAASVYSVEDNPALIQGNDGVGTQSNPFRIGQNLLVSGAGFDPELITVEIAGVQDYLGICSQSWTDSTFSMYLSQNLHDAFSSVTEPIELELSVKENGASLFSDLFFFHPNEFVVLYPGQESCEQLITPTATASVTYTSTFTITTTPTISFTPTSTTTVTLSPTSTITVTLSTTATLTPIISHTATTTFTSTRTATISFTPTTTTTNTPDISPTFTPTATYTPSMTDTTTPTLSATNTRIPQEEYSDLYYLPPPYTPIYAEIAEHYENIFGNQLWLGVQNKNQGITFEPTVNNPPEKDDGVWLFVRNQDLYPNGADEFRTYLRIGGEFGIKVRPRHEAIVIPTPITVDMTVWIDWDRNGTKEVIDQDTYVVLNSITLIVNQVNLLPLVVTIPPAYDYNKPTLLRIRLANAGAGPDPVIGPTWNGEVEDYLLLFSHPPTRTPTNSPTATFSSTSTSSVSPTNTLTVTVSTTPSITSTPTETGTITPTMTWQPGDWSDDYNLLVGYPILQEAWHATLLLQQLVYLGENPAPGIPAVDAESRVNDNPPEEDRGIRINEQYAGNYLSDNIFEIGFNRQNQIEAYFNKMCRWGSCPAKPNFVFALWIDWNNNGIFGDISEEIVHNKIYEDGPYGYWKQVIDYLSFPDYSTIPDCFDPLGCYRALRARIFPCYNCNNPGPGGQYFAGGEVEDYLLYIFDQPDSPTSTATITPTYTFSPTPTTTSTGSITTTPSHSSTTTMSPTNTHTPTDTPTPTDTSTSTATAMPQDCFDYWAEDPSYGNDFFYQSQVQLGILTVPFNTCDYCQTTIDDTNGDGDLYPSDDDFYIIWLEEGGDLSVNFTNVSIVPPSENLRVNIWNTNPDESHSIIYQETFDANQGFIFHMSEGGLYGIEVEADPTIPPISVTAWYCLDIFYIPNTPTPTITATNTATNTPTFSATITRTFTSTYTATMTFTATETPTFTPDCPLIQNGDFESGNSYWTTTYVTVTFTVVSTPVYQGSTAAQVIHSYSGSMSRGIEQIVQNVTEGVTYYLSGYSLLNDSDVTEVLMRIAWYSSPDGSGSQLSSNDSNSLTSQGTSWQLLSFAPTAPATARSAKIRLLFRTNGNSGAVYFDNIVWDCFPPPDTSTPTNTPSNTNTHTSTFTPTFTATFTPTNTITATYTSTDTATITETSTSTSTPFPCNPDDFDTAKGDGFPDDDNDPATLVTPPAVYAAQVIIDGPMHGPHNFHITTDDDWVVFEISDPDLVYSVESFVTLDPFLLSDTWMYEVRVNPSGPALIPGPGYDASKADDKIPGIDKGSLITLHPAVLGYPAKQRFYVRIIAWDETTQGCLPYNLAVYTAFPTATVTETQTNSPTSTNTSTATNTPTFTVTATNTSTATTLCAGLNKYEENDASITYSGSWNSYLDTRASGGQLFYTDDGTTPAIFDFNFTGNRIIWGAATNTDGGSVRIYINGYDQGLFILNDPLEFQAIILDYTLSIPQPINNLQVVVEDTPAGRVWTDFVCSNGTALLPTNTPTMTATNTPSFTYTGTSTFTPTFTTTFTPTSTDTNTSTATPTNTSTSTETSTVTYTPLPNCYDDNHPSMNYLGDNWAFASLAGPFGNTIHYSNDHDIPFDYVTFTFQNSSYLTWYTATNNGTGGYYGGKAFIFIDDVFQQIVDLNQDFRWQVLGYTYNGSFLPGTHTFTVMTVNPDSNHYVWHDQICIDGTVLE